MDFIMDVNDILDICAEKTKKNIKKMKLGLREYPGNTEGNYFDVPEENTKSFEHIMNWTASFFTGMAILSFDRTKDMEYLKWLNAQYPLYYSKVFDNPEENMHDMGFLFSTYGRLLFPVTCADGIFLLLPYQTLYEKQYCDGNFLYGDMLPGLRACILAVLCDSRRYAGGRAPASC